MRGFLAEYAQGDVYMEGIERKKEWGSGELADFFQQMAVMTGSVSYTHLTLPTTR